MSGQKDEKESVKIMKEKIIQKTLRISEKESRIVNQEAKKYGLSVNQYFKMLLLHRPKDYPEIREILTDLRNEVNRVGNNINQIARKANESFIDRSDITLVITCLKKLVVSTDSVLGEIMEITRLKKNRMEGLAYKTEVTSKCQAT